MVLKGESIKVRFCIPEKWSAKVLRVHFSKCTAERIFVFENKSGDRYLFKNSINFISHGNSEPRLKIQFDSLFILGVVADLKLCLPKH